MEEGGGQKRNKESGGFLERGGKRVKGSHTEGAVVARNSSKSIQSELAELKDALIRIFPNWTALSRYEASLTLECGQVSSRMHSGDFFLGLPIHSCSMMPTA